jgi:hypothetical protein
VPVWVASLYFPGGDWRARGGRSLALGPVAC